jgi:hypothetical protein
MSISNIGARPLPGLGGVHFPKTKTSDAHRRYTGERLRAPPKGVTGEAGETGESTLFVRFLRYQC